MRIDEGSVGVKIASITEHCRNIYIPYSRNWLTHSIFLVRVRLDSLSETVNAFSFEL